MCLCIRAYKCIWCQFPMIRNVDCICVYNCICTCICICICICICRRHHQSTTAAITTTTAVAILLGHPTISCQMGLELSLELSMSCQSLSYQPSSLSPPGSSTTGSRPWTNRAGSRPETNRSYHCLMRSEEMRQANRRLVIVILFQACLSSALGHVAPDSATCRTAASSARSARVAMTLRSNRETLTNLGTERLDPIWVRTAKAGRMIDHY